MTLQIYEAFTDRALRVQYLASPYFRIITCNLSRRVGKEAPRGPL
jgi:hypothetical protein